MREIENVITNKFILSKGFLKKFILLKTIKTIRAVLAKPVGRGTS